MATIKEGHEDITMSIHVHVCLSSKLCRLPAGWDGISCSGKERDLRTNSSMFVAPLGSSNWDTFPHLLLKHA